jgi:methyl-accepting chemotaxis protein
LFMREVNEDLRKYAQANPDFAEIGIAGKNGRVLTSSLIVVDDAWAQNRGGRAAERNIASEDYFETAIQGTDFVSKVRLNPDNGKSVFAIASPVKHDRTGEQLDTIGILYAMVDVNFFSGKFVAPRKIGQEGYIYIIDRDGTVIAHPDQGRILTENIAKTQIGGTILAQKDGLAQYSEDGQDWLVAFNTDDTLGWTVVAVASMKELMAPVRQTAFLNFFMTIAILVIAVGVIIFVAARVTRPINTITSSLYMVARQVSGASSQISSASQQLAQGSASQASSIEETSA